MKRVPSPPSSITGGILPSRPERAEIALDWVQGSYSIENLGAIKALLRVVGADFAPSATGRNWYACCEVAPNATFVAYSPGRSDAMFAIPGKVVGQLDAHGQFKLLQDCLALGVKFTRLDVRFDDYERIVEPLEIDEFARQRPQQLICYRQYYGVFPVDNVTGKLKGAAFYAGTRGRDGGGRQFCVYDKLLESGDESMDCVRWECRLYKERARVTGLYLCGSANVEQFVARLGECIGGNIDFRDRSSGDHHTDRLPRPEWWIKVLERVGRVVVRPVRITAKLKQTMAAIAHQYGSTFATIKMGLEAMGGNFFEFIDEVASAGESRMRPSHLNRLAEYIDEETRLESEFACKEF